MIVKRICCHLLNSSATVNKLIKFILFLLYYGSNLQSLEAGLEDLPVGARSIAMGMTSVAFANGAESVFLNPGGLSQLKGTHIAFFYQKPFGMSELNYGLAAATFSAYRQRLGIGVLTFGNSIYSEQMLALTYSRNYRDQLFWGVGIRVQRTQIDGYGSTATTGVDLGFVLPLHTQIDLGFLAKNLNRPSLGEIEERLPQTFRLGTTFKVNTQTLISLEIFKDIRFPEEIRFGAEVHLIENLAVRAGTGNNPSRFTAGVGMLFDRVHVDYAFFTHNDLGMTHQMSLSLQFGQRDATEPRTSPKVAALEVDDEKPHANAPPSSGDGAPKLNVNTASVADLVTLPGIGEHLAKAIVEYRKKHGFFRVPEDLLKVAGIGVKKLEAIRALIKLSDKID